MGTKLDCTSIYAYYKSFDEASNSHKIETGFLALHLHKISASLLGLWKYRSILCTKSYYLLFFLPLSQIGSHYNSCEIPYICHSIDVNVLLVPHSRWVHNTKVQKSIMVLSISFSIISSFFWPTLDIKIQWCIDPFPGRLQRRVKYEYFSNIWRVTRWFQSILLTKKDYYHQFNGYWNT